MSVDSKIVDMKFNYKEFSEGIKTVLTGLQELKTGLKLDGATKGLDEVNAATKRFSVSGILDNLGSVGGAITKLLNPIDTLKSALKLDGATGGFATVTDGLNGIGSVAGKLLNPIDTLKSALKFDEAASGFSNITTGLSTVASGIGKLFGPVASLASALKFEGSGAGLKEAEAGIAGVHAAAKKPVDFSGLTAGVQQVTAQFSAMQIAATTALATIVHKVVETGGMITKSLTLAPVMSGFSEYELKLGAIQTIMAGSGASLDVVNSKLQELNTYADKTIYSFGDMTQNIGKFTNAGVSLDMSVAAIKGIANAAALSGANSEEASRSMFNFSQALSTGVVKLNDWISIEKANMATVEFKQQIIDSAVALGTLTKKGDEYVTSTGTTVSATKGFREALQDGFITTDVLTTTLNRFSDATTDVGKRATAAAQDVKTMSQMFDTLKEGAQSGWAETWEIVFGNFDEAKQLFTSVNNVVGGIIGGWAESRNKLLSDWKALGGRTALIDGIKLAWEGLMSIIAPIREAFRDIFPEKTGRDLLNITVAFREFARGLKIGEETAANLKRTFKGFFAIFSIVGQVIGAALGTIGKFFGKVGEGSGSFLNVTGSIGDFLVALDEMLRKSGVLTKFFDGLGAIISIPFALLTALGKALADLFIGFDASGASSVSDTIDSVKQKLDPLQAAAKRVGDFLGRMGAQLKTVGSRIGEALGGIGDAIADAFSRVSFDKVLGIIQTGLLGGILLTLKKFFQGGDVSIDFGGGLLSSAKDALSGVSQTMQNMQQNLKADILMKIALAMITMAGAVVLLATVDSDKLAQSLGALAAGMGIMAGAMVVLMKALSTVGLVHIYVISAAFMKMAIAMLAVAAALKILSSMDIGDTIQALIAMGGALAVITLAMRLMPKGMVAQAAAIMILAVALNALAIAMKIFGTMDWDEIGRGLTVLAGSLVIIAAAMRLMPNGAMMILQAAGITILAVALNILAGALKIMATMSLSDIAHGLGVLAGSLLIIAAALHLMPAGPLMLLQAAGLVAIGVALNLIGLALTTMAGMSWEEIGKGLVTLGGALLILAAGLHLMTGTIGGAIALGIAAGALMLLTPVLITLGNLDWGTIIKGLVAIGGAFVVFALGGMLLAPLVPVFLGLAAAFLIFGAGMLLVGVGMAALGVGFVAIASAAGVAVAALAALIDAFLDNVVEIAKAIGTFLVEMVKAIAEAAPEIVSAFIDILVKFVEAVADNAPKIVDAFIKILTSLLDGVITMAPKIGEAILAILVAFLDLVIGYAPKLGEAFLTILMVILGVLRLAVPRIAAAALDIMTGFLNAIASRLEGVITAATNVVVAFITGVGNNLGRVIQAGVELIIKFVNGVAAAIDANSYAMGQAGGRLAMAIVQGMVKGIAGGITSVVTAAKNLAKSALDAAKNFLGIASPSKEFEKVGAFVGEGFVNGLLGSREDVAKSFDMLDEMLKDTIKSANESITKHEEKIADLTDKQNENAIATKAAADEFAKAEKTADKERAAEKLRKLNKTNDEYVASLVAVNAELAESKREAEKATAAHDKLSTGLFDEREMLNYLGHAYDRNAERLEAANKALEDAIKLRDDYNKSVEQQYTQNPDIGAETVLVDYMSELEKQIADTKEFATAIDKLRELGLNDELYKDLVDQGVDALPFVNQLLAGGEESVKQLNALSEQLDKTAAKLGRETSKSLYDAGVEAAQGLVDGLKSKESALRTQMEEIAKIMVEALKDALEIQSPSKKFREIGRWADEGLANGLAGYSSMVAKAADNVGQDALVALQTSMSRLSDAVIADVDINPTITPVLDLSDVKKNALQLKSIIGAQPISVEAAYSSAENASAGYRKNQVALLERQEAPAVVEQKLEYTQNNYSPKAISQAELYRQTNNLLSVKKGALKPSVNNN